jgi:hypothetical protein
MPAKAHRTLKAQVMNATLDDKLDQALEDSFPASDPVSFIEPGPLNAADRKLPVVEATARGKAAPKAVREPESRKGKGKATRS